MDVGKSSEARRHFTGLDEAPVVSFDVPGRYFSLEAPTPVSYTHLDVYKRQALYRA